MIPPILTIGITIPARDPKHSGGAKGSCKTGGDDGDDHDDGEVHGEDEDEDEDDDDDDDDEDEVDVEDEEEENDVKEENRSQDWEAHVLCEPAQSKCTWILDKSHFVWKFTGDYLDKHRALTAVRTPQCGHTVWGIIL